MMSRARCARRARVVERTTSRHAENVARHRWLGKVLQKCEPWYPDVDLHKRCEALRLVFDEMDVEDIGALDVSKLTP